MKFGNFVMETWCQSKFCHRPRSLWLQKGQMSAKLYPCLLHSDYWSITRVDYPIIWNDISKWPAEREYEKKRVWPYADVIWFFGGGKTTINCPKFAILTAKVPAIMQKYIKITDFICLFALCRHVLNINGFNRPAPNVRNIREVLTITMTTVLFSFLSSCTLVFILPDTVELRLRVSCLWYNLWSVYTKGTFTWIFKEFSKKFHFCCCFCNDANFGKNFSGFCNNKSVHKRLFMSNTNLDWVDGCGNKLLRNIFL